MNTGMSTSLPSTWLKLSNLLKQISLLLYLELISPILSQEAETARK
jgi:hypothetical protein